MCLISDIFFLPLFDGFINVIKNIQFNNSQYQSKSGTGYFSYNPDDRSND